MPDEHIEAFVACPRGEASHYPIGCVTMRCDACGHAVSVAPSSQALFKVYPGLRVLCTPCAAPLIDDPANEVAVPPGAFAELRRAGMTEDEIVEAALRFRFGDRP